MRNNLLMVALGGAAGSVLRYLVGRSINNSGFPLGTLIINLAGSFLIGLLFGYFTKTNQLASTGAILLMTGFCGGFTTFSAFSLENIEMMQSGQVFKALCYTAASVVFGILLCWLGKTVVQ